jgi:molybdate transport system substrate-binding protein
VHLYAAASTGPAVEAALADLPDAGGPAPVVVVGASSTLARQIEAGAPVDLFLSANTAWVAHLEQAGHIAPGAAAPLLGNALVLIAPADAPATATDPPDLPALLGEGRLAMGDPDHVPAGMYGAAALRAMGQWDAVAPRLARAPDTRAALALVDRGEVPLGIVYATDAASAPGVRVLATLPGDAHPPIVYPLVAVGDRAADPAVRAVLDHLQGPTARAVFHAHGFGTP